MDWTSVITDSTLSELPFKMELNEWGKIVMSPASNIYRDEVYNENSEDKGKAEIIIRKQRNGPTGTNKLYFLGQFTKFKNFSPEEQDYS